MRKEQKRNVRGGKDMNRKLLKKFVVVGALIGMLSTSVSAFAAEDYTVKSGDYLKKIAKQVYGDETKWEIIYEANKDSIKNPNLIYKGQTLTIPDAESNFSQVTDETISSTATETDVTVETVTAPEKNVPVGINPVLESNGYYTYTFVQGNQLTCTAQNYVAEATDLYGITYREYRQGANEIAMKKVADFIAQNPNSNFASMIMTYGSQFVLISSYQGLWDDVNDYSWYYNIVGCEPDDCVYMFLAGNAFDEDYVEDACVEMFNHVSDAITIN